MNKPLKKFSLVFLPSFLWVVLTGLGFGSQSLSNLIEIIGIFIVSVGFVAQRFHNYMILKVLIIF
ncbi:hypothetical protein NT90_18685 [Acinetobacter baumannii]|nr:hypothetical protein NT90_18685 [Acinetobacter baumannii]